MELLGDVDEIAVAKLITAIHGTATARHCFQVKWIGAVRRRDHVMLLHGQCRYFSIPHSVMEEYQKLDIEASLFLNLST
jgi:hypothetical protein